MPRMASGLRLSCFMFVFMLMFRNTESTKQTFTFKMVYVSDEAILLLLTVKY
jgi:hypothetical protein